MALRLLKPRRKENCLSMNNQPEGRNEAGTTRGNLSGEGLNAPDEFPEDSLEAVEDSDESFDDDVDDEEYVDEDDDSNVDEDNLSDIDSDE